MNEMKFPIGGTAIAPMIGRNSIMRRLWSNVSSTTPNHVTIIGPRWSGKSVLLKALHGRALEEDTPFAVSVYWDLSFNTPQSDVEFFDMLAQNLSTALKSAGIEGYGEYIDHLKKSDNQEDGIDYGQIKEVVEIVPADGKGLLFIFDGLDRPLAEDKLSRNLWDQLRELASIERVCFVAASRQRLSELIRSNDTATSHFWGVFDPNPISLGPLSDEDRDEAISKIEGLDWQSGASKELANWTGLFPPLLFIFMNRLCASMSGAKITKGTIDQLADEVGTTCEDWLASIWNDCSRRVKDTFLALHSGEKIKASDLGLHDLKQLKEFGLCIESGGNLSPSCRLLNVYANRNEVETGSLKRLFGSKLHFAENVRPLLELRLAQVSTLDPTIVRFITRSLEDIPNEPALSLVSIRSIVERVFVLIWQQEFGDVKKIPSSIYDRIKTQSPKIAGDFYELAIPGALGKQCRLLQIVVGADAQCSRLLTKRISRGTYALVGSLQGYGDYGQHTGGEPVKLSVAVAALVTAIELLISLSDDLSSTS